MWMIYYTFDKVVSKIRILKRRKNVRNLALNRNEFILFCILSVREHLEIRSKKIVLLTGLYM